DRRRVPARAAGHAPGVADGPARGPGVLVFDGAGSPESMVIIQPATPSAVAPLVTLAYGLSEWEPQVTRLCMQGLSTRQMANALALSPHTVQDHLKSIFAKTGVRRRSELVGQIFLEHYVPRWEDLADSPAA
ncbi:MAG TPA: helix-turn-helix transcriptional regulator, partial [Actinomycetota bacterium]|nr:helix-turn-helix transcriptional regulator [Actinomycetota bacterium]